MANLNTYFDIIQRQKINFFRRLAVSGDLLFPATCWWNRILVFCSKRLPIKLVTM